MNNDQSLINAAIRGQYYCPPGVHYNAQQPELVNVVCDRCGLGNLQACIGHGQIDLCLACNQVLLTLHEQNQQVNISNAENRRLFENTPIIKLIPIDGGFLTGIGECFLNTNSTHRPY
jgi:hypothetical protein